MKYMKIKVSAVYVSLSRVKDTIVSHTHKIPVGGAYELDNHQARNLAISISRAIQSKIEDAVGCVERPNKGL